MSIDGQPINAMQAVMRNVLRAADALPVVAVPWINELLGIPLNIPLYQIGLLAPAFNSRYQRLGDLACGTMVIFEERPWQFGVARVTEPEALRLAELIPLDFEVSRSLSRVSVGLRRSAAPIFLWPPGGNRPASGRTASSPLQPAAADQRRSAVVRLIPADVLRRGRWGGAESSAGSAG